MSKTAHPSAAGGASAWLAWSLAVAFVLYLFGFQTGYAVVNRGIADEVGLSVTQIGLVAALYTWSFAVFQLFSGALLDRLGARRVLLPAIALVTVGVFVFAHATSFSVIALAQLILALGACAGFVGAGYVGGQWFGYAKFSFMFGLVQCFASLFSAFNQNLLAFSLEHVGWRELFNWIGVIGIALLVICFLFLRDPPSLKDPGFGQGLGKFLGEVLSGLLRVMKIGHVWVAAGYGAMVFGALLASGVVWAPKLMLVRGLEAHMASLAASVLWLGLAAGCIVFPWWSDAVGRRKLPALAGIGLQLAALAALVYLPELRPAAAMALWSLFGFGAAAHMLAFSAAGDVVKVEQLGRSAAIVNGTMFLVSGFLISRPGAIAGKLAVAGASVTLDSAQTAMRPLVVSLIVALALGTLIRESHPKAAAAR
jgi:MFS family permease